MQIKENVNLKPYNTFGIDSFAKFFIEVNDVEEIVQLIEEPIYQNNPLLILGGGSNVLLTQDFDGLVLRNNIKGIDIVKEDEASVKIRVGAGEVWHQLVLHALENNWGGIENLSLIPGTVGAAPMQNIGAYGVEIKEVFHSLECLDLETGEERTFLNHECEFGYRTSIFKTRFKGQFIITHIYLELTKQHAINISYGAISQNLKEANIDKPTIKDVSKAVIDIRQSKLPDPVVIGNAGSFFKNPVVPLAQYEELKKTQFEVPGYPQSDGSVKVPAGWLIEKAGWKGKRIGDIGVHEKQALVLVNYGNGTGEELVQLAMDIKKSVLDTFGIEINPEVNII